jgi:transcriptional regulator with XRE-family HTH domain
MRKEDQIVGARIRDRRVMMGLSQEAVAVAIGISFQQLQKYEYGSNRVSVSRLCDIAKVLEVDPAYFLDPFSSYKPDVHKAATKDEADMLKYMRSMSDKARKAILGVAETFK